MKNIPNIFTLLNLFFGCIAIVLILQTNNFSFYQDADGTYKFAGIDSMPEQWWYASFFILLAAVVDFFDGFVARWLNATSELGKQLDSLADVVSFGVAPSMILYQMLRFSYMQEANAMEVNMLWLTPAFIVACAGAYRLARFNVSTNQSKYFTGVPIPAVGLVVASFPLIIYTNSFGLAHLLLNKWIVYAIIFILSWLMVCNHKMLSLKFSKSEIKQQVPLFGVVLVAAISYFFISWWAVPLAFIGYVVLSFFMQKKIKSANTHTYEIIENE